MTYNEDSSASGHDEPWIEWFCSLKGHEMFCHVERAYIEDGFNLYGLRACVSNYSDCLDLILDRLGPDDSDDSLLTQSACTLYGLIHARYIVTTHGLDSMYNKYAAKEFGICPLIQCNGQPVLPVGLRDEIGIDTAKVFCPKCKNVYHTTPSRSSSSRGSSNGGGGGSAVDGAAFGTTFPHLFLMTFNNLVPDPHPTDSMYVPRVFGFRVHRTAHRGSSGGGSDGTIVVGEAYLGNGQRAGGGEGGAAVTSYAQRCLTNMTSTTVDAGGGILHDGGNGVPVQESFNGGIEEVREDGDVVGVDDAKDIMLNEKTMITIPKPEESATAEEGRHCAINVTAIAKDGSKKREAGDTSDRSSSNASKKRPRCSVEALT